MSTFDVTKYGATGKADDSPGIAAAFKAACAAAAGGADQTVLLPAGRSFNVAKPVMLDVIRSGDRWDSNHDAPLASAKVHRAGVVTFEVAGATVKYVNKTLRYGWLQSPNPGNAGDTYGNVVIHGGHYDENGRAPSGMCSGVIWLPGKANFSNIAVRGVANTGVKANPDGIRKYGAKPCGPLYPIAIPGGGESAGAYTERILIDGAVLMSQGQCVYVAGGPNRVLDLIAQSNFVYDNLLWAGSNTMLGGSASGWRCSFVGGVCRNSLDDGIEVDAFAEALISDVRFTVNRQAICLTRIAATPPYKNKPEVVRITRANYYGALGRYWNQSSNQQPMMPEMRTNPNGVWTGPVTLYLDDCHAAWTGAGTAHPLFKIAGPTSVTTYVHDCSTMPSQKLVQSTGKVVYQ